MEFIPELIKQLPSAAAIIFVTYLFLRNESEREKARTEAAIKAEEKRVENAKALEQERQKHEREINNLWAGFLKRLAEDNAENFKALVQEIHAHEDKALARYNRLSVTSRKIKARNAKKRQE